MQPKFYGAAANYNKPSGSSSSNLRKVLMIVGLFFGVIILLVVVMSIISAITRGPQDEYSRLISRVDRLSALTQSQQNTIRNNDLRRANSTATMLLLGDSGALSRQLAPAFGIAAVPEEIALSEGETTTEPKLKQANQLGTFDSTYADILRDKIAAAAALAQTVDTSTNNEKIKAVLGKLLEDLTEIDRQLSEIKF